MIVYATEPIENCWEDFVRLAQDHWHETMQWQHGKQPFNPSFARYNTYEKAGLLVWFTARDDGKLIGHAAAYLSPSMHTQALIATEDFIFLIPEYRHGRNGLRFAEFMITEMTKRGAVEITATVKPDSPAAKLLDFLGFEVVNYQCSKHLAQTVP